LKSASAGIHRGSGPTPNHQSSPFEVQQGKVPGEVEHGAVRNARRGRCAPPPAVACGHPRPPQRAAPQDGAGRGGETAPSRTEKQVHGRPLSTAWSCCSVGRRLELLLGHPCSVEQQQVLARQLAFLLCVPPRGGTQFGILRSEPRHGGGEIGGYARQSCGYYDLVEDAAVRRVEWVSAASRLPRDCGGGNAHRAPGQGRVRRLALDQPVERGAVSPGGVLSLRRCPAGLRPALVGLAPLGCHSGPPRCA